MPAKDNDYWLNRAIKGPGAAWYMDKWLDWLTIGLWRSAFRRLDPAINPYSTLIDVGCGGGVHANWLAVHYNTWTLGIDQFDFTPKVKSWNVQFKHGIDIEHVADLYPKYGFDWALVSGVLEGVQDWRKAMQQVLHIANKVIFVEDLRMKVPPYQQHLPHKQAITWPDFKAQIQSTGHRIEKWVPMTVLDRHLVHLLPGLKALTVPVTAGVDRLLTRLPKSFTDTRACFRMVQVI